MIWPAGTWGWPRCWRSPPSSSPCSRWSARCATTAAGLPLRIGAAALAAQAALIAVGYLTIGPEAGGLFIYLAVMAVFLLPAGPGWLVVAACITASLAVPGVVHGWQPDGTLAFQVFVSALAAWGVVQLIQRNRQLTEARNEITRLALADERNRFARDLHDILGHSLTVIAVKAELAGRLVEPGPGPGRGARSPTWNGSPGTRWPTSGRRSRAYREVTLASELASARTALAAAGVQADLPDPVGGRAAGSGSELFGWTVREGVTNVVRHSGATRCRSGSLPARSRSATTAAARAAGDGSAEAPTPLRAAGAGAERRRAWADRAAGARRRRRRCRQRGPVATGGLPAAGRVP